MKLQIDHHTGNCVPYFLINFTQRTLLKSWLAAGLSKNQAYFFHFKINYYYFANYVLLSFLDSVYQVVEEAKQPTVQEEEQGEQSTVQVEEQAKQPTVQVVEQG